MNRQLMPTSFDALGEFLPHPLRQAAQPGPAAELTVALSADTRQPPAALGKRLLARVAASAQANATMTTLLRPRLAAPEEGWPAGTRARTLQGQSWLLELEAGAPLPTHAEGTHELLVLEGSLQGPELQLGRQAYAVCAASLPLRAGSAARVYLRRHGANDPFQAPSQPHTVSTPSWQPLREGVEIAPLFGQNGAVTMLARFAAGAQVPAHPHGVDEQCLMVEGDLFLGDLLLPEGGYQFAPGGSKHGELAADMPCLLFFHGAIDAAAIDNSHRAAQGWPAL